MGDLIRERNLKINLRGNGVELTPTVSGYIVNRVTRLGRVLYREKGEVFVYFEVSQTTKHHRSGQIFRADCKINLGGREFYSSAEEDDLYTAIDEVKDQLFQEIDQSRKKSETIWRRGARSVKKMLKGLSARNPFTSKY